LPCDRGPMFLWKNAVVLCGLLGIAAFPGALLVQARWETGYLARLVTSAMLIAMLAVCAMPMLWTQLLFGLLLISCFDQRVPMAATYLFFFFSTPAAGSLLGIAGAYIAPLTPFMTFSGALLAGYLIHPTHHLRRPFLMSDVCLLLFILIYCTCVSLRASATGVARNIATYGVPYALSYFVLSHVRIAKPEAVLRLITLGAAAGALPCIFETLRHWPLYAGVAGIKGDLWTIDAPRTWLERGGVLRAFGPYAHPLTGSAMLGIAAVAAWGLFLARGRSGALLFLVLMISGGLAATLSRSGLIAAAIGLMVFQMLRGRYLLAVLVPLAGIALLVTLPILGGEDAQFSNVYRLGLVTGVPQALGSHVWLGYREAVEQGLLDEFIQGQGIVDLVNSYISLIVQGGLVSLAAFCLFLASTFPHYRAILRMRPDREELLLAQALVAVQAALIVALALLSGWSAPMQLSFLVIAMLIALRFNLASDRARDAPDRARLVATAPLDPGEALPALR